MTKKFAGKSDEAVKTATGKSWDEWFAILDKAGLKKLPHKEIVLWLWDKKYVTSGWWAQSIVVGYEQKIGRRVVGQIAENDFSTSTSITLNETMDAALKKWEVLVKDKTEFNKIIIKDNPRITKTVKWRYWKIDLADGSKINADITAKSDEKVSLVVTHYKLKDKKSADFWKKYWKEFLEAL